ncbi:MAG: AI-2E family transporter, partial [Gammaproteobacteria bacterium]|nr:AI-2E family transporter [Gammaproteobacteria bacterium]
MTVLALLAVVWMLDWAQVVLVPVMLAVLISYALAPVVDGLHRWRIPRAAGAALLLLGMLGGAGALAFTLADE